MTVTKSLLSCALLIAAAGFPVSASSLVTVSASADTNSCSQSGSISASCNVSFVVGSQTASASAAATAAWPPGGSGILEATATGFGSNTNALANVLFSNPIVVTGGPGTGDLQIVFSGFQMNIINIPNGASVSPVGIGIGSFSTNVTLPNGAPQTFSVTAPITFGQITLFNVAFSATASGTFFHDGTFAIDNADGILQFPTFVVTAASGAVLPNASVQFVPEPATWLFVASGLVALFLVRFSQPRRSVRKA